MKSKLLQNTKAGIHLRLSNDDERIGESLSIENQRRIFEKYVMEQGFELVDTYIDDGVSGTSFDRPGVQRLLEDECDKKYTARSTSIYREYSSFVIKEILNRM